MAEEDREPLDDAAGDRAIDDDTTKISLRGRDYRDGLATAEPVTGDSPGVSKAEMALAKAGLACGWMAAPWRMSAPRVSHCVFFMVSTDHGMIHDNAIVQ